MDIDFWSFGAELPCRPPLNPGFYLSRRLPRACGKPAELMKAPACWF
jgi:hypothetical protein